MSSLETSSLSVSLVLLSVGALPSFNEKEEGLREAGHWPMPSISWPHWESWNLSLETVWTTGLVLPITAMLLS